MELAKIAETREERETKRLIEYLSGVAANAKDRIEALRELAENQWIPDEMYQRFIIGEKLCLLDELQNYIDLYKGLN